MPLNNRQTQDYIAYRVNLIFKVISSLGSSVFSFHMGILIPGRHNVLAIWLWILIIIYA